MGEVRFDDGKVVRLARVDIGNHSAGDKDAKVQIRDVAQDGLRFAPAAAGAGDDGDAVGLGAGDGAAVGEADLATVVEKSAVKIDADQRVVVHGEAILPAQGV